MSKHLEWCFKDKNRLTTSKIDIDLARKHLSKSEYNFNILQTLEELKIYDWALNVGFYSIYHCFLAILAKYGYESKNQSCTISVLLNLIDENKLNFERDLISQFDSLDNEKDLINPSIRESREVSTYGVRTSVDLNQLERIKELVVKIQRETVRVLHE
ncbi:MAG: HEPN domain-containing protein [Nanoarchaeota archaeon]